MFSVTLPQANIIVTRHVSQICQWTIGPLSSATCPRMFMQFTGCHQPVQRFYWSGNTIDCLENANNIRNAICADTRVLNGCYLKDKLPTNKLKLTFK